MIGGVVTVVTIYTWCRNLRRPQERANRVHNLQQINVHAHPYEILASAERAHVSSINWTAAHTRAEVTNAMTASINQWLHTDFTNPAADDAVEKIVEKLRDKANEALRQKFRDYAFAHDKPPVLAETNIYKDSAGYGDLVDAFTRGRATREAEAELDSFPHDAVDSLSRSLAHEARKKYYVDKWDEATQLIDAADAAAKAAVTKQEEVKDKLADLAKTMKEEEERGETKNEAANKQRQLDLDKELKQYEQEQKKWEQDHDTHTKDRADHKDKADESKHDASEARKQWDHHMEHMH